MIKFPEVDALNMYLIENRAALASPVEVSEKLDGSNMSICRSASDDSIEFYSRNGLVSSDNYSMFSKAIDFLTSLTDTLKDDEVIFGENMFKHRIDYGANIAPFYAFGVYNIDDSRFISNWQRRVKRLHIPAVPVIRTKDIMTFDQLKELATANSLVGKSNNECEGIIIKNYDTQVSYKVVNPRYIESHTQKPPREPMSMDVHTSDFVERHATEARALKAIFRLRDECGVEPSMVMMPQLIIEFRNDIIKECHEDWNALNAKQFNAGVASIARATLMKHLDGEI